MQVDCQPITVSDFEALTDGNLDPSYFAEAYKHLRECGDLRAVLSFIRTAEQYRDSNLVTVTDFLSSELPEILRFSSYSLGYSDPNLEVKTHHYVPRHDAKADSACSDAEVFYINSLSGGLRNEGNKIFQDEDASPVLFQKGINEKTALGLVPLGVLDSNGKTVFYPRGWIYSLILNKHERNVESGSPKYIKLPMSELVAVRPIRPSVFSFEDPLSKKLGSAYAKIQLDEVNIDRIIEIIKLKIA